MLSQSREEKPIRMPNYNRKRSASMPLPKREEIKEESESESEQGTESLTPHD